MSAMIVSLIRALSVVLLLLPAASQQAQRHTFRTTVDARPNPERGFRTQLVNARIKRPSDEPPGGPFPWPDPNLRHAAEFNLSVVQTYCYLGSESDTLNASLLEAMDAGFERHRQAGVKSLFRFAYDACAPSDSGKGTGNYTTDRVLKHIEQLAPIVKRNADVIMAMYAGFLGCWGEWHGSKYKLENNSSAVSMVVAGVLDMLPADRKALLRYPFDKCCGRDKLGGVLRAGVVPSMQWAVAAGINPIVTLEKQLLNIIGNLV
jgi:hypothetical protein